MKSKSNLQVVKFIEKEFKDEKFRDFLIEILTASEVEINDYRDRIKNEKAK